MLITGCGQEYAGFPYADEQYAYPTAALDLPLVHLGEVRDLRPAVQHTGEGRFTGITYPKDRNWELPVTAMYRDALIKDLSQTHLAELVPLRSQADFILEAEIESFHIRMTRSGASFMVPPAVALVAGFLLGDDIGSALKRAGVLTVITYGAIPLPTKQRAEVVVRLVLRDLDGHVVWEQTCLGEVEDKVGEAATSRREKMYAERYLPQAVKRANACLLGQMRQFLLSQ
jgi:hypothetical protein